MIGDQLFFRAGATEPVRGDSVSTPYGSGTVVDKAFRYATVGAQEQTLHVKIRTPSDSVHWFEVKYLEETI